MFINRFKEQTEWKRTIRSQRIQF